jgi:beta-galactosidase
MMKKSEDFMRKIISFNNDWKFSKDADNWEAVTLPHTWNAKDGQDGGNDYYRGTCVYEKTFAMPAHNRDERVYLEIPAAAFTAKVILNGVETAFHEGGYSLFRADITDLLQTENTLKIEVSNAANDRCYPQYADFTFYGGLYRGVNLVIVPSQHFEMDDHGSCGVYVTPKLSEDLKSADVEIKAQIKGTGKVTFTIGAQSEEAEIINGCASAVIHLEPVHLWNGLDDPYLYELSAVSESDDRVFVRFGCRRYYTDPDKGFFLNGRSYPLRGVSRHQDRQGAGNALTLEMHQEDMAIIKEIGANTLRLAHYQQAQEFYDLCDENGLVVWAEIPMISKFMANGKENSLSQMKELVKQNYNHPSIICWGLSNEITAASPVNDELLENHRELNDLCHELDHTRFTTMADVFMLETDSELLKIPDVNSYNLYFGWYLGELEENDSFFDEYHKTYPDRVIGFSEYGADANPQYQSPNPSKGDYTESYQAVYHEHMLKMINERPYLWATHVWNLFDFAADGRDEGGKHGENQKGLVTFDRKLKKDAFYLYKAAWNHKDPFVHLCGSRYINRNEDETEIKVYSNESTVILLVNGTPLQKQEGSTIFRFHLKLKKGNTYLITAKSEHASDTMTIKSVEEQDPSYQYAGTKTVTNWFDTSDINPDYYSIEDTLGELKMDPKAGAIINQMMEAGAKARGDVADQVKDNPALQKMLGRQKLISILKQSGADEKTVKQLNQILQAIPKNH